MINEFEKMYNKIESFDYGKYCKEYFTKVQIFLIYTLIIM